MSDAKADSGAMALASSNGDLQKSRLDLAWKHFDFHAKQRTTMFHYFSTIAPLIVAGYFYFLKEDPVAYLPVTLFMVALTGLVLSSAFWLLEIRNRQLISTSELNLCLLEREYLYSKPTVYFAVSAPNGVDIYSIEENIADSIESARRFDGIFNENLRSEKRVFGLAQYRHVMMTIYGGSTAIFVMFALYAGAKQFCWVP